MATIVTGLPCSSRAAVRANQWPADKAAAETMHSGLPAAPGRSAAAETTAESARMSAADNARETAENICIETSPKPSRLPAPVLVNHTDSAGVSRYSHSRHE